MVADEPDLNESETTADQGLGYRVGQAFGVGIVLAVLCGVVGVVIWGLVDAFPSDIPKKDDPGYLDIVFQNRFVVWAARIVLFGIAIVLLFGSIYTAISVIVRIKRRQWLRRVGWFESEVASQAAEDIAEGEDALLESLHEAWETNETLSERLEAANVERERLYQELQDAYEELGRR